MIKRNSTPSRYGLARRRTAGAIFAAGALMLSSGMVVMAATSASANNGNGNGQHVPVNVCHATNSDTNPYVFVTVDNDSTKLLGNKAGNNGHLTHRNSPNKVWKVDTWWNGEWHAANSPKRDYVESFTDELGTAYALDGKFDSAFCDQLGSGAIEVTPAVTWDEPDCDNKGVASWTGSRSDSITYTLTSGTPGPRQTVTVAAVANAGYVFPKGTPSSFVHKFADFDSDDCVAGGLTRVAPVAPTLTASTCVNGQPTVATVNKPADANGITYAVNGSKVTATITDTASNEWDTMPAGWQQLDADTATYTVPPAELANAQCDSSTPPTTPVTDVCPNLTGNQADVPEGLEVNQGGQCVPVPGPSQGVDVCKNLPGDQANIPDGMVEDDGFCAEVKGVETIAPPENTPGINKPGVHKPGTTDRPAEVAGTQAAIPTGADAGLATVPAASSGSVTALLAQLLVAGGLLLLVTGGCIGLGRRTRGVHEA